MICKIEKDVRLKLTPFGGEPRMTNANKPIVEARIMGKPGWLTRKTDIFKVHKSQKINPF